MLLLIYVKEQLVLFANVSKIRTFKGLGYKEILLRPG